MSLRQKIAIGVINELKNFTLEDFKAYLRKLEGGYLDGINFPLGTVKDDALNLLNVMISFGVAVKMEDGSYVCLIES
jgi:hypothetical protein